MSIKQHELFRYCVASLAVACVCGCASSARPVRNASATSSTPLATRPLPAEYPEETAGWDTGAPVMILALASNPHTLQFAAALKPALEKRGYTVMDMPFYESDWMSAALRVQAKLIVPETFIMQGSPVYQEQQITDLCQQVLVVDGKGASAKNPGIKTFHVWARQEHPSKNFRKPALMETLVENLMRMPAFRAALQQQKE